MTSARTSTYFCYSLLLKNQINVLSPVLAHAGSAVLQIQGVSCQGEVSRLTTAHLAGYMKVMGVEIND